MKDGRSTPRVRLSPCEVGRLCRLWQSRGQGCWHARDRLVEANLGLVGYALRRWGCAGLEYDDAFQAGVIGLMEGVDRFDPERGVKFSTYALYWVRQKIRRAGLGTHRLIRIPEHAYRDHERTTPLPSTCLSLDAPTTVDGDTPRVECVASDDPPPDAGVSTWDDSRLADRLLSRLPTRHAEVIRHRYGFDGHGPAKTLAATGERMGFTRERARQIECTAMQALRKAAG